MVLGGGSGGLSCFVHGRFVAKSSSDGYESLSTVIGLSEGDPSLEVDVVIIVLEYDAGEYLVDLICFIKVEIREEDEAGTEEECPMLFEDPASSSSGLVIFLLRRLAGGTARAVPTRGYCPRK